MKKPQLVKEILPVTLKKLGIEKHIQEYTAVEKWNDIVGKKISEKTKAVEIKRGILWVEVENSVWMQELIFLKEKILKKLNGKLGKHLVDDIKFVLKRD